MLDKLKDKLTKKNIIIIISCVLVAICLCVSIFLNKNKDQGDTEDNQQYAQQDVDATTEENLEVEALTYETKTEERTTEDYSSELMATFNVKDDVNANNPNIKNYNSESGKGTISIDGKLVTFPCTYDELASIFKLYTAIENPIYTSSATDASSTDAHVSQAIIDEPYIVESDTIKDSYSSSEQYLFAYPETGVGEIRFKFISKTNDKQLLKNLICIGTELTAFDLENNELFTISLSDNIHFGSTAEEIRDAYGHISGNDYYNKNKIFNLYYGTNKDDDYSFTFYGYNDGLTHVIMYYEKY